MFDRVKWEMVCSFESNISRKSGKIYLDCTTFWVSADRKGEMHIQFEEDASEYLGRYISNRAVTLACNTSNDTSFVIGFAPDRGQAEAALKSHELDGQVVLIDSIGGEERSLTRRPIRRGRKRSM